MGSSELESYRVKAQIVILLEEACLRFSASVYAARTLSPKSVNQSNALDPFQV